MIYEWITWGMFRRSIIKKEKRQEYLEFDLKNIFFVNTTQNNLWV
jgi:hypothetical protein